MVVGSPPAPRPLPLPPAPRPLPLPAGSPSAAPPRRLPVRCPSPAGHTSASAEPPTGQESHPPQRSRHTKIWPARMLRLTSGYCVPVRASDGDSPSAEVKPVADIRETLAQLDRKLANIRDQVGDLAQEPEALVPPAPPPARRSLPEPILPVEPRPAFPRVDHIADPWSPPSLAGVTASPPPTEARPRPPLQPPRPRPRTPRLALAPAASRGALATRADPRSHRPANPRPSRRSDRTAAHDPRPAPERRSRSCPNLRPAARRAGG